MQLLPAQKLTYVLIACVATLASACGGDDNGATSDAGNGAGRCAIDEVAQCDTNANCSVLDGVPTCECNEGFSGNGVSCQEIDACAAVPAPCDANATCENATGIAVCICDAGYEGNGESCENVDECAQALDDCDEASEDCVDGDGSFTCECKDGFVDDSGTCVIDAATYVADVSSRPISIEIAGVGSYDIGGLGRVAVEIEAVSSPGSGIRIERVPNAVIYHDITFRNVSAQDGSSLASLTNWVQGGSAVSATMNLDGLGTEELNLNIFEMQAISSDVTVTSDSLAEIVVTVSSFVLRDYVGPTPVSAPNDATVVEIEAITLMAFADSDIIVAAPDTAEPVTLEQGKNHSSGSPFFGDSSDLIGWMEDSIDEFDASGDISRHSVAQVFRNANGMEINRTNCFETFPGQLTFFNPLNTYGQTQLVDLVILTEFCEGA